jgi:hypothetical protein
MSNILEMQKLELDSGLSEIGQMGATSCVMKSCNGKDPAQP